MNRLDEEEQMRDAIFDAFENSQRSRGITPVHNAEDIATAWTVLRPYLAIPQARIRRALELLTDAMTETGSQRDADRYAAIFDVLTGDKGPST